MATLDVDRPYSDGNPLTEAMLDDFLDDIETFINTTKINDDNIQTAGITASTKLVDGSINAAKIASDAVTTAKILDANVTAAKLASDAVTTVKILDANVTVAKLAAAVQALLLPPGAISAYTASTAPTGWLVCDGSQVNRTTYADLYAIIGTKYGSGDGATTFHLPDLRGRFLRGYDNGAGNDSNAVTRTAINSGGSTGDNVGSLQADAFQGHYHDIRFPRFTGEGGASSADSWREGESLATSATGYASTIITNGSNGTPRIASETRPKNVSVQYIIKT